MASLHDVELATLAATGDRRAFGELVRRHGSAVRALLRRMGADPAAADDLAQDAFLAAFERVAEFRGEGTFAGWVKRIAARLYIRRWRRRGRLDEAVELDESHAGASEGEGQAAGRIDLDDALKSLSEAERLCVSLCYGAGLSHGEAAQVLETPLGTVKSHVKRGMDKLRTRLGAEPTPAHSASTPRGAPLKPEGSPMADQSFEGRVSRLFAETPAFADDRLFVARVEQRLDQGWGVRRIAIGAAGLTGGCIAVAQLVGGNLFGRIDAVSRSSLHDARAGAGTVLGRAAELAPALKALPLGGETLWLIAGMAVLAAALFATRALEDL